MQIKIMQIYIHVYRKKTQISSKESIIPHTERRLRGRKEILTVFSENNIVCGWVRNTKLV